MSRERSLSLDCSQRRQQQKNPCSIFLPETSPNIAHNRFISHHAPHASEINLRNEACSGNSIGEDKLLDDYEEPSFYDLPPNSSFDDVMCIMATPPTVMQPTSPTAAEKLDAFRKEVAEVIQQDDLRKSIATSADQRWLAHVDEIRKSPLCLYTIPPLPKDPHAIPPPPKDPNDVVAIIRRARAISRLKAYEEARVTSKPSKNVAKRVPTAGVAKKLFKKSIRSANKKISKPHSSTQNQPGDVTNEWAAAILRTRKLAGLKTTNPRLLPKHETLLRCPSPQKSVAPPTYTNILERVAKIKSRASEANAALEDKKKNTAQDELHLQNRVNIQKHLQISGVESLSEELDEFEILEQLYGATPANERPVSEYIETDLQHRINALHQQLFQSPVITDDQNAVKEQSAFRYQNLVGNNESETDLNQKAQTSRTLRTSPRATSNLTALKWDHSPIVAPEICSKFDDDILRSKDIPEFYVNNVPAFAGFEVQDDILLGDISVPDFYENISLDEPGLADITSPDLCSLSISGDGFVVEPNYNLTAEDNYENKAVREEMSEQPGFLGAVVNAVVGSLRNIFASSKIDNEQKEEEETELELDSSLPNMFGITRTPPAKIDTESKIEQKDLTLKDPIIVPLHPKNPKDYIAMVKRAQAIQKKKAEESNMTAISAHQSKAEKKTASKNKIHHYSSSDIKAVARARSLAGLKNASTLLNPELAERKAAREEKLAAIQAMPPVERMRKKMRSVHKRMGGLPRSSVEASAALEATRSNLPKFNTQKSRGRELDVMSPISEVSQLKNIDFIQFSPLKPHEALLRLRYLKEQAVKRSTEANKAAEEKAEITITTLNSETEKPRAETPLSQFCPIKLQSPHSQTTEEIRRDKTITKIGQYGDSETIRDQVTETSTIENGEVHTSTKKVITNTDQYGNVTHHVRECKGLSEKEKTIPEYLDNIEPPDFLDTSFILPRRDSLVSNSAEIIDSIESKIKPTVPKLLKSSASLALIDFPQNLTDEELYDIEAPSFKTPLKTLPHVKNASSIEKDQRMYAWGEFPHPQCPTPKDFLSPEIAEYISPTTKLPENISCIPPHPKDPRDYKAMVKRAQAIQKLKQDFKVKNTSPKQSLAKNVKAPRKEPRRPARRDYKVLPKIMRRKPKDECLSENLPLPQKYIEEVARSRLMYGLKNISTAFNPEDAIEQTAVEIAQDVFDALPKVGKIKRKVEKLGKVPAKNRCFEPSADILGTLAAIKANMPPLEGATASSYLTPYLDHVQEVVCLPSRDISLEEFENIETALKSNLSLVECEAPETEAKTTNYDTPRRAYRHWGRQLIHPFPTPPRPPSLQDKEKYDLAYYDAIQDFRIPFENIVLETSQLMPETPPRNLQEKYQRIKEAHKRQTIFPEYSEEFVETTYTPTTDFSPIRLISPSSTVNSMLEEKKQKSSPISLLVNLDQATERKNPKSKQFGDLQDMPFDELEYEAEPSLINISYEKPLSPPPKPSDIIHRIKHRVQQKLIESAKLLPTIPPVMIKMPEDLTDEELSKISAPSFTKTSRTPQPKYESPAYLHADLEESWPFIQFSPVTSPRILTPVIGSTSCPSQEDVEQGIHTPEGPIVIPPHPKDPKDYAAIIKRTKTINQLKKQKEGEVARALTQQTFKKFPRKGGLPISRWQEPPDKKISIQPKNQLVLKRRFQNGANQKRTILQQTEECPVVLPTPSQKYRDAIARARLLHGLKNRTAALNPKIAAKIAANKAAKEAAAAAYNSLPEIEKIKLRMERLRRKPYHRRSIKPTIEQIAYLEALKQIGEYQTFYPTSATPRSTSVTPRLDSRQITDIDSRELAELAEFEDLEQFDAASVYPIVLTENITLQQRITNLEKQLLEDTPEIRYRPVTFASSPSKEELKKRAEKSTIPITRSNDIVTDHVTETSQIVNGKLHHFTTHVATTADPQGDVAYQIKESKRLFVKDSSPESVEDLDNIQEPSFLDTTPLTPMERPRPIDIIDRIRRQVNGRYRPEVPTGQLIELRTPPRMLPLPKEVPEEDLQNVSCPSFQITPPRSPERSSISSPNGSPEVSIPKFFKVTPRPSTPLINRATQIQQLIEHDEAKKQAAEEAEARAIAEDSKPKTQRNPISRWTSPPVKKSGKRKKLIMKATKTLAKQSKLDEASSLPENFAKEVALSRLLAGLKNRTVASDPDVAKKLAAPNDLLRSPIKDYATVLSRMKEIKKNGAELRGQQPSFAAAAYLNAVKGAMQVRQDQQYINESPKTRYGKILAARKCMPSPIKESPIRTPTADMAYSPIHFVSPCNGTINLAQSIKQYGFDQAAFESLKELENISEFEQPSYMHVTQHDLNEDHYMPLTPPQTPPPLPSAIIRRIHQQYEQQKDKISPQIPTSTPMVLGFPEELPEEEIFEVSAPFFAQSLISLETPSMSPNITIPLYFEETPKSTNSRRYLPPTAAMVSKEINTISPVPGVYSGDKVKTPHGSNTIPHRPKNPEKANLTSSSVPAIATAPPLYANTIDRFAVLNRKMKVQKGATARELTQRQHLINRQQRQERQGLLRELRKMQNQQSFEFEPMETPTPLTAKERLEAIKSRMVAEIPTSSVHPYTPVKTPDVVDVPKYQPILLSPISPYQHLENDYIEDTSIQFDDFDDYTKDFNTADIEDLEFQMTEAAQSAYTRIDKNISAEEFKKADNFDIGKKIEMLQQQLLKSPSRVNSEIQEYNMAERMEILQKQLLQTPMQEESPMKESSKDSFHRDISDFDEDGELYGRKNIYDELMDDFEAMERECM